MGGVEKGASSWFGKLSQRGSSPTRSFSYITSNMASQDKEVDWAWSYSTRSKCWVSVIVSCDIYKALTIVPFWCTDVTVCRYHEATIAISKRDKLVAAAAELIETKLTLIGATAIEDKLQAVSTFLCCHNLLAESSKCLQRETITVCR